MDSLFQNRINAMRASKDQRLKADAEYNRRQIIQRIVYESDDFRNELRNLLQRDSKLCQLEQIKERELQRKARKDIENAWDKIHSHVNNGREMKELKICEDRKRESLEIQEFNRTFHDDSSREMQNVKLCYDEENKTNSKIAAEDEQMKKNIQREREKIAKKFKNELELQMMQNEKLKRTHYENDLKLEQNINQKIEHELKEDLQMKQQKDENFRRSVFDYLENLAETRRFHKTVEREAEKIINDIQTKIVNEQWNRILDFDKKRRAVNDTARAGQLLQIYEQKKKLREELSKAREENFQFNERESNERRKLIEENYRKRIQAYRYGCELMEQKKSEELRDLADKQKLEEKLMLADQQRNQRDNEAKEFVQSFKDVLPLHPNLLMIQRGLKY